jgi:GntR family transcriptional regulator
MALRKDHDARERGSADDKRSMHLRIAADVRDQILSGDLEPGEKVLSTQLMAEHYDSSPTTVQNAVRLLKEEGLLAGRAGVGVTAREHLMRVMRPASYFAPAEPGERYRWLAEAERLGMSAESELLEVGEVEAPLSVAKALGIAKGAPVVRRKQLLKLNGEPAELVENYYPIEIARGTAIEINRKVKGGVPTLLAEMGYPFKRAVDRVSARTPTFEQGRLLKLPMPDLPVLRTFRVVYSADDVVIEVSVLAKAGHLYELEYETRA